MVRPIDNIDAEILKKQLSVVSESYIPVNKHSRILLDYKNVDEVYVHLYKGSHRKIEEISDRAFNNNDSILFVHLGELTIVPLQYSCELHLILRTQ